MQTAIKPYAGCTVTIVGPTLTKIFGELLERVLYFRGYPWHLSLPLSWPSVLCYFTAWTYLCLFAKRDRLKMCWLVSKLFSLGMSVHPACMPDNKHLSTRGSRTSGFPERGCEAASSRNIKHKLNDLHGHVLCPCFMNTGVIPELKSGRSAVKSLHHY